MKIFINYRREDTSGYAGRIFDSLSKQFGSENIFIDVTKIGIGENFSQAINMTLDLCDCQLVLIGNSWISCKDQDGNARLHNTNDFVRKEIVYAFNRGIKIIPILLEGARMPNPKDLPETLSGLCDLQGIEISDTRWEYDIKRLIKSLPLKTSVIKGYLWKLPLAVSLLIAVSAFLLYKPKPLLEFTSLSLNSSNFSVKFELEKGSYAVNRDSIFIKMDTANIRYIPPPVLNDTTIIQDSSHLKYLRVGIAKWENGSWTPKHWSNKLQLDFALNENPLVILPAYNFSIFRGDIPDISTYFIVFEIHDYFPKAKISAYSYAFSESNIF